MVTDSLSTISRLSLLDAGNNFSAAFLDAGGDTNAAVAPPEGAEAADEEMADANPTLLRPIQTQRCRNFMKIQIPTTSSDLIEKRQHLKTGNICMYAALVLWTFENPQFFVKDFRDHLHKVEGRGRYGLWPYHKPYKKIQRKSKG